jgi:hypothetical protein
VRKTQEAGFAAGVFKKGSRNWFVTVARGQGNDHDGFGTEVDAQSANYTVRAKIRGGTYVVNLKEWCKDPQPQPQGYVQCSNN